MILLLATAALATAAEAGSKAREITGSFALEQGQDLRLDLSVGEIRVEGAAIDRVEIELRVTCRWGSSEDCEELLEKVELESRTSARRRIVEIVSDSSWRKTKLEIEGDFRVPRGVALEVDMGVGELTISGVAADVSADLGVGELSIRMKRAAVRSVALDAGVGEAKLLGAGTFVEGRRSMLVGSEVFWDEGEGEARVRADVGVGEATVYLE
jgi:hypothetical protein